MKCRRHFCLPKCFSYPRTLCTSVPGFRDLTRLTFILRDHYSSSFHRRSLNPIFFLTCTCLQASGEGARDGISD